VAARSWRVEPELAFDRLARARALNPLSDRPDQVAGAIASRLGRWELMELHFRRAVERNPHNWYSHFELAVASALDDRRRDALEQLERARTLSPSEPAIQMLTEQIRAGRPVSPHRLDALFLRRLDPAYDPGVAD
jgi:tetratricopeptide (TPR) repeat protein